MPIFVVPILVFLNLVVFALWQVLGPRSEFMALNFLVSLAHLMAGRVWTLLLSEFSHASTLHLALNMIALWSFGRHLERALGPFRFLGFYLAAACASSLSHSLLSAFLLGEPGLPALGASGAVSGVILVFSLLFPRERILLFAVIPVPAIVGALLLVGLDLWGLYAQAHGGTLPIGHGAHLGGAITGFLYYWFRLRGRFERG